MRKLLFSVCCLFSLPTFAFDDPYFRQTESLLRIFNPAFNGIEDFDKRTLLFSFRDQWMNFSKGAPLTFSGTYGGHFDKLHGGVDISYLYDQFGIQKNNFIGLKYDAQFNLGEKTKLGLGIRASFGFISLDFSNIITTTPDPALPTGLQKANIIPDIDAGLMITRGTSFFFSASARHLTQPVASVTGPTGIKFEIDHEYRTYYAMMGGTWKPGDHFKLMYAADYRLTRDVGIGEARIEARWRFVYGGFHCIVGNWENYTNPYGFTLGFSRKESRLHLLTGYEPPYSNSTLGGSMEAGLKYVFGKKD